MRKWLLYIWLCTAVVLLSGCQNLFRKKTNWQVTLKKEDKIPYGTYLAFNSLKYYFPGTKINTLSRWYRYNSLTDTTRADNRGKSLLILVGLDFFISSAEWEELQNFAASGNEIILFCSNLDQKIEAKFNFQKYRNGYEEIPLNEYNTGKDNEHVLILADGRAAYGYEGRSLQGYFEAGHHTSADTGDLISIAKEINSFVPDTLGFVNNRTDFMRYAIGRGHITLHAAPLVLSNYFLLQPGNRQYLDGIWRTLPSGISTLYWNEYYKRSNKGSDLGMLWKHPSTRWAIILAILTLLLYVIFEGKRRQRIIPIVDMPENTSVTFVETVGRLYYNKGDHTNLAEKIVQHFLEWVRTNYHLNTNEINDSFTQQLKMKSGQPDQVVTRLVHMVHEIRLRSVAVDETYLYDLYYTIQLFYNSKAK